MFFLSFFLYLFILLFVSFNNFFFSFNAFFFCDIASAVLFTSIVAGRQTKIDSSARRIYYYTWHCFV